MNKVNAKPRVTIGARIQPALAEAVARLAEDGDRSVSREIERAVRAHVARSDAGGSVASSPPPAVPDERDGNPGEVGRGDVPSQLAGLERDER